MTTCYETKVAGFELKLTQTRDGLFTVVYGKQKFTKLGYRKAAQELGECLMHALACEGNLDNERGR